jgi:hypothetical protein
MILFVTTRGHEYTVQALVRGGFGGELPDVRVTSYDRLFLSRKTRSATHIFADIERLQPWERRLAADHYQMLGAIGIRRLNDPARVKTRYELLRALHREGFNPFQAYRAEDHPRPERFPVFLRYESDHESPISPLIETQDSLDDFVEGLPAAGTPLQGVIVIEYCAEPIAPNLWKKYATFAIGGRLQLDHTLVGETWCVKHGLGDVSRVTEEKFIDEREAITENRFAEAIAPAFGIGQIEYGRADHGTVDGRQVVYEINTNPMVRSVRQELSPIRDEAFAIGRERLAALLRQVDSGDGRRIPVPRTELLEQYRRRNFWRLSPKRP